MEVCIIFGTMLTTMFIMDIQRTNDYIISILTSIILSIICLLIAFMVLFCPFFDINFHMDEIIADARRHIERNNLN